QLGALIFLFPDIHLARRAAEDFLGLIAGQPRETLVDLDVAAAVALGDGDGVGTGVERLGEFFLAGLERLFGELLLSDVAESRGDAALPVDAQEAAGNQAGQYAPIAGAVLRLHVI